MRQDSTVLEAFQHSDWNLPGLGRAILLFTHGSCREKIGCLIDDY